MILGWREQMVWSTISEHVVLEMKKNNKKIKKNKKLWRFCFMWSEQSACNERLSIRTKIVAF